MKPSNLLLNSDCLMKVADFGLARSFNIDGHEEDGDAVFTDYIATRWYRAPEILLGSNKYSTAVDMWGAGCILGEILAGKPVFAGSSTIQQLELICGLVGKPNWSRSECERISPYTHNMLNDLQLESQDGGTREAWVKHFPNATSPALDLLQQLLRFDPEQRTSAEDALKHEYLKQFHFEEVERNAPCKVNIHPPDYEKKSTAHYRERLYKEVTKIRNEDKKRDDQVLQENRVGAPNTGMPRRR